MGHLFSRAIKRFTQCSSANQLPSREQQEASQQQQAQQQRERDSRPIAQTISVGQSIDSAEYATFETDTSTKKGRSAPEPTAREETKKVAPLSRIREDKTEDKENEQQNVSNQDDSEQVAQNKPEVEEAVIKIQALVRGHLTRKALKDAQQQAATPLHNALGQSQFDEESLTKNPPSAVFLPSSPLNTTANNDLFNDQNNRFGNSSPATPARVPPLESIAEDVETATATATNEPHQSAAASDGRRKLLPNNRSLAISIESRSDSVSPAPSEANASIDLNCGTPASASIDILDHNIRAIDSIATVLHIKEPQRASSPSITVPNQPSEVDSPQSTTHVAGTNLSTSLSPERPSNMALMTNSHSIDSAEAAAIRIQSAFRGYHTRKHSPYRRRSPGTTPTSPPASQENNHCNNNNENCLPTGTELRHQDAIVVDNSNEGDIRQSNGMGLYDDNGLTRVENSERRLSRQRQRPGQADEDLDQMMRDLTSSSVDEFTLTTEDQSTVRETPQRPIATVDDTQQSLSALQTKSANSTIDESSNSTCVTLLPSDSRTHGNTSNEPLNLAQGENSIKVNDQRTAGDGADISIDRNVSVELDTDSSNLGAALSLNEDISLGIDAQPFEQIEHEQSSAKEGANFDEDKSDGTSLINDELASEARRLVEQLTNDDDVDDADDNESRALEKATDQLKAALESATEEDFDGYKGAENLANAILDEEEQRMIELESDDIERRDPRGHVSEDRVKSPSIRTNHQQPALVSGDSLDDEAGVCGAALEQSDEPQNQKLGVEAPDEAIGSGRSSPALVSSNGGSGSSEEDEADEVEVKETAGRTEHKQVESKDEVNKQQGGKNKKKNRNRKKGRK